MTYTIEISYNHCRKSKIILGDDFLLLENPMNNYITIWIWKLNRVLRWHTRIQKSVRFLPTSHTCFDKVLIKFTLPTKKATYSGKASQERYRCYMQNLNGAYAAVRVLSADALGFPRSWKGDSPEKGLVSFRPKLDPPWAKQGLGHSKQLSRRRCCRQRQGLRGCHTTHGMAWQVGRDAPRQTPFRGSGCMPGPHPPMLF